ncbi:SDR family NAD(P)-dependent oxidoreductase [Hymenobacter sp. DG25A]|uniref:SDR family NAD(P)-dependent oxidoreductase n=1 Tax=Hymenobacter sp. DG25A TaxID=1385663 RepID=UPI0006BCEEB1|nr:SDR family NAD(P)-dependent oxidoreductase [Hymenobacter sp. DG25A]ALD22323.1 short-chain dehydrogenase [Hymenobacter sp. DG25A]
MVSSSPAPRPYALITGASRGIGRSLALGLARRGYNLLLTARSAELLNELVQHVCSKYGVQAHALPLDLAEPNAVGQLAEWATGLAPDLSVVMNNAGYGLWGKFEELPLATQLNMLQLNMQVPVTLTHLLLPTLHKAQRAYILNVASTAAYQAVPTLTLYAASKAFLVSFSRGLRYELRASNISVTCLSPGSTDTNFADRAGMNKAMQQTAAKFSMTADQVAHAAITALFAGQAEVIPGALNRLSAGLTRVVPKDLTEKIAAGIYEKYLP